MAEPIWIDIPTTKSYDELAADSPWQRLRNLPDGPERRALIEEMRKYGMLPPENDGFFVEFGEGAGMAALDVMRGIGSTAEELGMGSGMRQYFDEAKAGHQDWNPHPGYTAMSLNPGNLGRTIGSGVAQSTLSMAAGFATTLATGGNAVAGTAVMTGVMFGQIYGDRVKEYRQVMPDQDEGTIRGLAFISAAGESLIESVIGPEQIATGIAKSMVTKAMKETTKSFVRRFGAEVAKNFISEGSEEVAQDFWNRLVQSAGTGNFELPSWEEVREQFFGGAIPGALMGGGGEIFNTVTGRYATPAQGDNTATQDNPAMRDKNATPKEVRPEDVTPLDAENEAAGQAVGEALYDENGIPLSRMTPEEQNTEGVGFVNQDGEEVEANGLYDKDTKSVKINPSNEGELFSHGHEFDHWLSDNHKDLADQLHQVMDEELNEQGEAELDGRDRSELHADMMGRILEDPKTLMLAVKKGNAIDANFGVRFLHAVVQYCKRMMAYLKEHTEIKGAEQYFKDYKRVRDTAASILAETKKRSLANEKQHSADVGISTDQQGDARLPKLTKVSELNVDPERFQFKGEADKKTGVTRPLQGQFDQRQARPLYVWEDKTGKKFVVEGHHRLDLAKRSGVEEVLTHTDREADGVTWEAARQKGVWQNIKDNQGSIKDYADYFRSTDMTEDAAKKEGLLTEEKGRMGFAIGRYATDELYNAHKAGEVSDRKAATIAYIARGDKALEAAGIRAAKNMGAEQLGEFLRLLKKIPNEKRVASTGDLFGFDDSAIKTAEAVSKLALKHIKEITDTLRAANSAIRNPEAAAKLNVTVGKQAKALRDKMMKELERWQHYDTDPELYQQLLKEAGLAAEETPQAETPQAPAETPKVEDKTPKQNTQEKAEAPKTEAAKTETTAADTHGRFNPDSETPLLTLEEDANDFQLTDETAADKAKREAAEAKAEQEAQKRKENAAKRETGDLFGESKKQSAGKYDSILAELPPATKAKVEKILSLESPTAQEAELSKLLSRMDGGNVKDNVLKIWRSIYDATHGERSARAKTESPYTVTGEQGTTAYYKTKEDAERAVKNAAALGVALQIKDNPDYKATTQTQPPTVPTGYKTFDKDGNWTLDRSLGELQDEFIAAINGGRHIRIKTPKGTAHIMKSGNGFHFEGVDGKIRQWSESAIREVLARFITSPNENISITEESPSEHFDDRKISRDGSLLRVGDQGAFGLTKEHPALYVGEVVSIGKKNVKLKTQSQMYGEQVLTLPWSDYKAHYPKSDIQLSGEELARFKDEHGGNTPEQIDQAKVSFMEQHLLREGQPERRITSGAYERSQKRLQQKVESTMGLNGNSRQYSLKKTGDKATRLENAEKITDDDFLKPYRNIELPPLPEKTLSLIGKQSKPVLLKKNIFEKNRDRHPEITPEQSRKILSEALYQTDEIILDKPKEKPNYRVFVKFDADNSLVTLEVSETKDAFEIVGWRFAREKSIEQIKNRAIREGGQVLVTEHENSAQGSSGLHDLSDGSDSNITDTSENSSPADEKSANSGGIQHSLKRKHRQVNPIFEDGAVKDEYQQRLDQPYTVRHDSELVRDAERMIERFGGINGTIDAVVTGDLNPMSDTAQVALKTILNSDELKKRSIEDRNKIADVYIKSIGSGTELGRALRARRLGLLDFNDIKSIQAHVNAFMAKIDQKKPHNTLRDQILKDFGFDIEALPDDILTDKGKLDELIRKLAAERATWGDKLYEYWINAILSGPSTHAANVFGNTANAVYELGVKRFAEALVNTVTKRKDGASFGEFKQMLHAFDWGNAWRRAKLAYDYEALSVDGGKLEQIRTAIGGKLGQKIRIPGRLLRAADEFAKTLIQPIEAAAMAYREATAAGLKGRDLEVYVENALKDDASTANEWGRQRALELTFQEKPGDYVQKLIQMRESGGVTGTVLKYVLPFIKTPTNILKQGIRKSPLGVVNLAWETGKLAFGKRQFDGQYVQLLAEQLVAWGAVATMLSMGSDDDDDLPFITGSSPEYGSNEAKFKANKIPSYSIRIGGKYYSYKRIEPLATSLAFIADGIAAYRAVNRGEDGAKVMRKLMSGTKRMIVEKSFLDSLGEINRLVEDPERHWMKSLTNFAAGWVPNIVRQTVGAYDDNVHDTKSRAKGAKWWEEQFMITVDRAGIPVAAPKLDYFGREVKKDSVSGPWWATRLIPVKYIDPDQNMTRAEKLIMRYNQQHPDEPYYPGIPAYYFQRNGQKFYMEGANYQEFQKRAGALALRQLENAFRHRVLNADRPTARDIKIIKGVFTKARKIVRDKMYAEGKYSR